MREKLDLRGRNTLGNEVGETFQYTECRIFRRARDLRDRKLAGVGIEQNQIGMRAAHIDAEAVPVTIGRHGLA